VTETKSNKDPKKVAAGRAGAAARKVKQERLLEEARTAKESLRSNSSSTVPVEALARSEGTDGQEQERRAHRLNWNPWLIVSCLAGAALLFQRLRVPKEQAQTKSPAVAPQVQRDSVSKPDNPPCVKQLKVASDPFYME